jgi:hypothetical protein
VKETISDAARLTKGAAIKTGQFVASGYVVGKEIITEALNDNTQQ